MASIDINVNVNITSKLNLGTHHYGMMLWVAYSNAGDLIYLVKVMHGNLAAGTSSTENYWTWLVV